MAAQHRPPFDAYTLYYVAQALYQVGGEPWKKGYPRLRDAVVAGQIQRAAGPGPRRRVAADGPRRRPARASCT